MTSSDVITTSSLFEEDMILKNYNADSNKMKQITPGVDLEIFTPDLTIKRENIFLSIGRIQEQKGQIETIKFLDNFRKVDNNFFLVKEKLPFFGKRQKELLTEKPLKICLSH